MNQCPGLLKNSDCGRDSRVGHAVYASRNVGRFVIIKQSTTNELLILLWNFNTEPGIRARAASRPERREPAQKLSREASQRLAKVPAPTNPLVASTVRKPWVSACKKPLRRFQETQLLAASVPGCVPLSLRLFFSVPACALFVCLSMGLSAAGWPLHVSVRRNLSAYRMRARRVYRRLGALYKLTSIMYDAHIDLSIEIEFIL